MFNTDTNPPAPGGPESDEPTIIANRSGGASPPAPSEEPTQPGPPVPPIESTQPASPSSSDETIVAALAPTSGPAAEPSAESIHNQDTVVSPRLRQLAQTPSQPLRPPPGEPPKPAAASAVAGLPPRLIMLVGAIAVLILLVLILIGALLTTKSGIVASLFATKTPTATPTRAATPTSPFPPTSAPTRALPTATATPVPPTATPRPAPVALAKDVLAKVTPPEGIKLKVRESASTGAKILGELDMDAEVAIIDGPTDANGITWWKVDNGKGLVGWSAEGVGGVEYLVPVGWAK
jgi:hypothetical protein